MAVIFVFLAGIATIAAVWLSRQGLTAKPWLEQGASGEFPDSDRSSLPAAKIGLGFFLAVVGSLFALLISAYFMRMEMPDWRPLPGLRILWLNTGLLIASSLALRGSIAAARRGRLESVQICLFGAGLTTLAFVAGQLIAWHWLLTEGYAFAQNPANAFFFLITGLHGLHVLGGLVALGRTIDKAWRGVDLDHLRKSLELCAMYWHFLLLVWLVLLAVLTGFADDFAAICRGLLPS